MTTFVYARKLAHILGKAISFAFFGFGSVILALTVVPWVKLTVHPILRQKKVLRKVIKQAFSLLVQLMKFLRLIRIRVDNPKVLENLNGVIVCANHPTLIDVVILLSLVPDSNCLVKSSLLKNPFVNGVIGSVYVPNSLSTEETLEACRKSLLEGTNLILFPEGTRTVANEKKKLHKSSARLSLTTGKPILPIRITATQPSGLGKGEPFFTTPPSGFVEYQFHIETLLEPAPYQSDSIYVGTKLLTESLQKFIILGEN